LKKSEWNDKQLEDLLKQLPKIRDDRDPHDIYQNISRKLKQKKHKLWVMPSVAAVSVLTLVIILSTNLTYWQEIKEKTVENSNESMEIALNEDASSAQQMDEIPNEGTNRVYVEDSSQDETASNSLKMLDTSMNYSAIYEDEISGNEILTFAIPDKQAENIVPVSVLVPKNPQKTKMKLFLETMPRLTEEKWGLDNYYPLVAKLNYFEEQKELLVDVPVDHPYGEGSAAEEMFQNVLLNEHDSLEVDKISLFTEGKLGIEFSNDGMIKTFQNEKTRNHAYYLFYPNDEQFKPYLIPSDQYFSSIKEALTAMKENIQTHGLEASIPTMMDFQSIDDSNKTLILSLTNYSNLENNQSTIYALEAILLTAKDFDFDAVRIKNSPIQEIGKFILDDEIKVPVASNKQIIE